MNAEWEFIDVCTLATEVEDTNLGIGYTTVESRFWIWLEESQLDNFGNEGALSSGQARFRCDFDSVV